MPKFPSGEENMVEGAIKQSVEAVKVSETPKIETELPKKSKGKSVEMAEVLAKIHKFIDRAQEDINEEFVAIPEAVAKDLAEQEPYFIVKNGFWDAWLQKLIAQIISVKIWIISLITVLLILGYITNVQFVTVLGIITGLKGTFQVASVWKNGKSNSTAMDKT